MHAARETAGRGWADQSSAAGTLPAPEGGRLGGGICEWRSGSVEDSEPSGARAWARGAAGARDHNDFQSQELVVATLVKRVGGPPVVTVVVPGKVLTSVQAAKVYRR